MGIAILARRYFHIGIYIMIIKVLIVNKILLEYGRNEYSIRINRLPPLTDIEQLIGETWKK